MSNAKLNTLEKLCYNNETANKAFKLIYQLAITENELRQQAYFIFIDLFQVHLAETSIDLNARLNILNELIKQSGVTELIINAYERGLKAFGFIGHVHDANDNMTDKQFRPHPKQISEYQMTIINRLKEMVINDSNGLGHFAKNALTSRLSEQLYYGEEKLMLQTIKEITDFEQKIGSDLRNKLIELSSKQADLFDDSKETINEILEKFKPQGIEEELKINVIEAPWINEKNDQGSFTNISAKNAADLANKYIDKKLNWLPYLKLLLEGEQRHTFYFAEAIAKKGIDKGIINQIIDCFKRIPLERQNSVFVNGIVIGSDNDDFTRYVIKELTSNPETEAHGINQVRFLKPVKREDLELIRPLLEKQPEYLRNIEYIDLTGFSDADLIDVVSWIKNINYSFALQLLHDVLRKQDRWDDLKGVINDYLYVDGILQLKSFINISLHIEDLIKKSIADEPSSENIQFIINQLIKGYDDLNISNDSILDSLTYFLLEGYWDIAWDYYGEYLTSSKTYSFGLKFLFERYQFDNRKLFAWVKKSSEKNAQLAMSFMKLFDEDEHGNLEWNPIAVQLISEYGNQVQLLDNLSSRLHSYSINTYSAEGLFKKRKKLVEQLKEHELSQVKEFAKIEIDYFDRRIEEERKFGENYKLGR